MIAYLGWVLMLIGTIWLVVTAIQTSTETQDKVIWGLVNFLCQPIGGIVYYVMKKQGLVPLLLVIAGWVIMIFGGGMAILQGMGSINP